MEGSFLKTILCYGDSLTWGYAPVSGVRYPKDIRWTGVLARGLGPDFAVIEEGLSGRTTVFDVFYNPNLNGEDHLEAELLTHAPLDLVILLLGTNDLQLGRTAWEASRGAGRLASIVKSNAACFSAGVAKVLLVAPPHLGANLAQVDCSPMAETGRAESLKFAPFYSLAAKRNDCYYLDAGAVAEPSPLDAVHFDETGHRLMGEAVAKKVRSILK